AMEPQRQFENAGPETLERLCYVWVAALGNDGQGAGKLDLRPLGKRLELFPRRPDPLNRPRPHHRLYVVKYDNESQAWSLEPFFCPWVRFEGLGQFGRLRLPEASPWAGKSKIRVVS